MSGLAETLAENQRLRALVEEREAQLKGLLETQKELVLTRGQLEVALERLEQLERQQALAEALARGPKSQRYVPEGQAELPFPREVEPPPRAPEPEPETPEDDEEDAPAKTKGSKRRPRRRGREAFAQLPARTVRCKADPEARCPGCGGAFESAGTATSFRVEWVPGHFLVEDVVRDKCRCPRCTDQGVLTVPGPYALDRALCGNSLLARVLVDKFCDHLPLHRQTRRMEREGFEIGSQTLAAWVQGGAALLRPVVEALRADLLSSAWIQGDDTGLPVQDGGDGTLRKGRMWVFTDQQHALYAFTPTKQGVYPAELLRGFGGELVLVDGGSEFNQVVREQGLARAGCWSHLRTYFWKARAHHPDPARLALDTIRDLFLLERKVKGKPPDEVLAFRKQHTQALIDGFFRWVQALSTHARPQSTLGQALTYARNQEAAMRLHLERGELPLSNNLSELLLRQNVVGRKNWLFARSEGGANAAATIYSLVGSCMLQGLDPHTYLRDLLDRLPDHPRNRVGELTPRAWREARSTHTTEAG